MKRTYTLLFIGDSITDVGRYGANAPLGAGYPRLVHDLLVARYPEKRLAVINKGLSGNTIKDLATRWQTDVLDQRPDWLGILIGVNDAGHVMHKRGDWSQHIPAAFRGYYEGILSQTRRHLPHCHIAIKEPFLLSVDRSTSLRGKMRCGLAAYQRIARAMSKKFKTDYIPFQALFDRQMRANESRTFSPDACHPNLAGHMIIADRVLKVIEPLLP